MFRSLLQKSPARQFFSFFLLSCYVSLNLYRIQSLGSSLISLISFKSFFGAWYKNPAWRFALHCCCQDLLWFSFSLVVITESLQAPKSRVIRHCLLDSWSISQNSNTKEANNQPVTIKNGLTKTCLLLKKWWTQTT